MRKRPKKAAIDEVAKAYVDAFKAAFPDVESEIVYDAPGGFDVWISVGIPKEMEEQYDEKYDEIEELRREVRQKYDDDETGVHVVVTIGIEEPVHG